MAISLIIRHIEDWLRYDPSTRQMLARVFLVRSDWCRDSLKKLDHLCKAIRLAAPSRLRTALINQANKLADSGNITKDDVLKSNSAYKESTINRGLLLKPRISDKEPGVLFISYEMEWARLLNIQDLEAFAKDYRIVVAPSSSPPHSPFNFMFPRLYPTPVYNLISNPADVEFFKQMSDDYQPIELYASNWVLPELFEPKPKNERDIDILMVAMFGKVKRHVVLFKALQKMPKEIKVTLVGQPWNGRDAEVIRNEARAYGVEDRITIHQSIYGKELMELFCQAKTSLILSKREGSCVVVTESMFADTPVGLLEDAAIGSKVFINESTGRLLSEKRLAEELTEFIAQHTDYTPRQWAIDNEISCHGSTNVLNRVFKEAAMAAGEGWTEDIVEHHWRPDPIYVVPPPEDLKNDADRIKSVYGLTVKGGADS